MIYGIDKKYSQKFPTVLQQILTRVIQGYVKKIFIFGLTYHSKPNLEIFCIL